MRPINRIEPNLDIRLMKTYSVAAPKDTHWTKVGCAEFRCSAYAEGWTTTIDESTEQGKAQAYYIRNNSGRKYHEHRRANMTKFSFEAGQECFRRAEHKVRIDRPELYVVRDGDWRGNPTGNIRKHTNPADWIDDFNNNQDKLITLHERG